MAPAEPAIAALTAEVHALRATVQALREEEGHRAEELRRLRADLLEIGRATLDDEAATRRLLAAVRDAPGYAAPFDEPDPLVSVCIPTYTNYRGLVERAIPSALAQEHENIEVVVVGDAAPLETAAAIHALGDARVCYENLPVRGPYPDDPHRSWLIAGTGPLNRSMDLARGAWIAILNDDDALRPGHVRSLIAAARERRAEVAYGKLEQRAPDGSTRLYGAFPPETGLFGWQAALQHRSIARLFQYELYAAVFDEPGDWHRARRMLRAGVRFAMIDDIVSDYYPASLWGGR